MISWDGVTYRKAGLLPPTSSQLTITSSGSGSISAVTGFYYYYRWYDSTRGIASDIYPLTGITGAIGSITSVSTITLSSFPVTCTSGETADTIQLFRSNDGGNVPYFTTSASIGTQVLNDTTLDTGLGEEASVRNGVMPATNYCISAKRRVWAGGMSKYDTSTVTVSSGSNQVIGTTSSGWQDGLRMRYFSVSSSSRIYEIQSVETTSNLTLTQAYGEAGTAGTTYTIYGDPSRLFFSEIDSTDTALPESCYTGLDYGDFIDVGSGEDNDEITGLGTAKAYTLLVFKRNKTYAVSGTSKSDFYQQCVNDGMGCCSHWTIANNPEGLTIFFTGRHVMMTDGVNFTNIGDEKIDDLLMDLNTDYNSLSHAVYYKKRKWYMLWVTSKWATSPDLCLIYDFDMKEWYMREVSATCSAIIYNTTDQQDEVWIGTSDGFVHKLDQDAYLNQSCMSGTTRGTVTSASATVIADTSASYFSSGDGLKGVWVTISSGPGIGQRRLITSSTGSSLTVSSQWVVTPVDGTSQYCLGGWRSYWYSKWIDLDSPDFKRFYDFIMSYLNQKDSTPVKVSFFTDLVSDAGTVAATYDSPTLTGTNTLWSDDDIGKSLFVSGHAFEYIISSVPSQTEVKLHREYKGTTGSGLKYCQELFSTTIDCNTGFDAIIDMATRCRYIKFRIGMLDTDRQFLIYSAGYSADQEKLT